MNAEQFQRHISQEENVSRETLALYQQWLDLLTHWNKRINLVSPTTIHDFWLRHALDSWQLVKLLPKTTKTVLDMGAGAGFPGLAMAIDLRDNPKTQITLVESNGKKCNFLRTAIREMSLPAIVHQERVENLPPKPYNIITSRAFAPLPKLLEYSLPFWQGPQPEPDNTRRQAVMDKISEKTEIQTTALFPKGESWQSEVDAARKLFDFDLSTIDSQTADNAKILTITNLTARDLEQ